jgi:phosphomannomutase/phosphoglucomutase
LYSLTRRPLGSLSSGVATSPVSEQRMHDLFEAMDSVLRTHPEVGEYNQRI